MARFYKCARSVVIWNPPPPVSLAKFSWPRIAFWHRSKERMKLYFHFPYTLMACTGTNLAISFSYVFSELTSSWLIGWLVQWTGSVPSAEILVCVMLEGLTSAGWWRYQTVIGVVILRYRLVSWSQPMLVVGRSET